MSVLVRVRQRGRVAGLRRIAFYAAALAIAMAGRLPLWGMVLYAPQYPEGLRVLVSPRGLTGDLDLINTLNHYIGARPIRPEDFPELTYLSPVLAGLALLALLPAFHPRRWLGATAFLAALGTAAFGLWLLQARLYRFGHELDPDAPLQIPPFTPPVLGSNRLANFVTFSFFGAGGWLMAGALVLMALAVWKWERWR